MELVNILGLRSLSLWGFLVGNQGGRGYRSGSVHRDAGRQLAQGIRSHL